MKKNLFLLAAFICCLCVHTACASTQTSKNATRKQVEVGSFHTISTSSSIDVLYTQSSGKQEVEIYTTPRLMELVEVVVDNGVLKVGFKRSTKSISIKDEPLEVRVTAPAVNALKASSSGDIKLLNGLKSSGTLLISASSSGDIKGKEIACDELIVKTSSSGDIELEQISTKTIVAEGSSSGDIELKRITAMEVTAKSSSSSELDLTGRCEKATFVASSSGDIDAKNLKAMEVNATASSSGDISCYATDKLTVKTSSGGEIKYRGTPLQIESAQKVNLRQLK